MYPIKWYELLLVTQTILNEQFGASNVNPLQITNYKLQITRKANTLQACYKKSFTENYIICEITLS